MFLSARIRRSASLQGNTLQVNPEVDLWNRSRNGKPADLIARPLSVFRFGAFLPFCLGSLFLILNPIRRSRLIIPKDYQKIRAADFTDWCFAFSACQKRRGRITGQNHRKRQRTYSIYRRKMMVGLPKQDARMIKRSAVAGWLPSRPEKRCTSCIGLGRMRSCRNDLFAGRAGVHVDFHAHRHFDDFGSLPGHLRSPLARKRRFAASEG